ncbi:MAG: DUF4230 domain-containing protein [Micromonosporaceae bacterium]|nr:DUF4230 domain-containing protein [Micromonosporaceae bacterium]
MSEPTPEQSEQFARGRVAHSDLHPTAELPMARAGEVDTGTGWPEDAAQREQTTLRVRPTAADSDDGEYAEVQRRPGRRGGCLFWIAGMLAIVVVLALGARLAGFWPHLQNPFGSKKTDRSGPTLLLSIQDLSQFVAASGNFQVVIDVQKDQKYIPDVVVNDRTLFVAAGTVDAYVDFTNIGNGDVIDSVDHKSAAIQLPAPQLKPAALDQGRSYVFAEQRGIWNRITSVFNNDPNRMQELYQYGVQKIDEAAKASDLAQRAQDNTTKMLVQLLHSLGYTQISVKFANP